MMRGCALLVGKDPLQLDQNDDATQPMIRY